MQCAEYSLWSAVCGVQSVVSAVCTVQTWSKADLNCAPAKWNRSHHEARPPRVIIWAPVASPLCIRTSRPTSSANWRGPKKRLCAEQLQTAGHYLQVEGANYPRWLSGGLAAATQLWPH